MLSRACVRVVTAVIQCMENSDELDELEVVNTWLLVSAKSSSGSISIAVSWSLVDPSFTGVEGKFDECVVVGAEDRSAVAGRNRSCVKCLGRSMMVVRACRIS